MYIPLVQITSMDSARYRASVPGPRWRTNANTMQRRVARVARFWARTGHAQWRVSVPIVLGRPSVGLPEGCLAKRSAALWCPVEVASLHAWAGEAH